MSDLIELMKEVTDGADVYVELREGYNGTVVQYIFSGLEDENFSLDMLYSNIMEKRFYHSVFMKYEYCSFF